MKHSRLHPPPELVESATFTLTPANVKRAMKVSALADADLRKILGEESKTSLAALKQEGWRLALPVSEGVTPTLRRRKRGCWEYAPTMRQLHNEDAGTALSLAIFGNCESAKLAMERGDTQKALGFAFLVGFYCGRSNAIYLEAEANRAKRQGKMKQKTLELKKIYLNIIRKHNCIKTSQVIDLLPKDALNSASMKSHQNRIREILNGRSPFAAL